MKLESWGASTGSGLPSEDCQSYALSRAAEAQLAELIAYTAILFGKPQARRLARKLFAAARLLAAMPTIGHVRLDLTDLPVLFWTVPKLGITLVYDPSAEPVLIVHLVGPGQEVAALFE